MIPPLPMLRTKSCFTAQILTCITCFSTNETKASLETITHNHKKVNCHIYIHTHTQSRGPFEKFVDWRQCTAIMQREAVTVMPSCSGGGNVVVA